MNRTRVIFLAAALAAAPLPGQELVILNNDHSLPGMPEQSMMKSRFFVSNTTDRPVEIAQVKTTCGCTYAKARTNIIAPHAVTVVDFVFKSWERYGDYRKSLVLITSNEEYDMDFTATVIPFFKPPEGQIDLGRIGRTGRIRTEFTIEVFGGCRDVEMLEIITRPKVIDVEWKYRKGKSDILVSLTIDPAHYTGPKLHDGISFSLKCGNHAKRFTVPLYAEFTD